MIQIFRFSDNGFESQYQGHLVEDTSKTLEDLFKDVDALKNVDHAHLKRLIKLGYEPTDELFEFDGIFVFLLSPTEEDKRFYLNHIKDKDINKIALNTAQINPEAICYLDNNVMYSKKNRMTVKEALIKNNNNIYIPKSQLHHISFELMEMSTS
jgi:hypothetical protein